MDTMTIVLLVVLIGVIIFVIVTTITGRKASKKEKEKRYQEVREKIKGFIAKEEGRKNLRIEFQKVYARKGVEYKYRDVFDVVVEIIEPKTNKILEIKAYEVEGITTKIDKKNYKTDWMVNSVLELEETKKRIAISEKEIKLTKDEKQQLKKDEKLKEKELKEKEKIEYKKVKAEAKENKGKEPTGETSNDRMVRHLKTQKFVPTRKKAE
ncbi:hypothetical protein [Williamsoniiplasma lucivorax]|uniref:Uncharacterized protein n=1 Tax=Williamsoniiplasma lucivorax TaxID=209274 RepID=A0A2S5RD52_9MOLU|nr:hypothetical protein [Williamsoniiplasma lucivorax]PPE05214.1 hypothetical protein ELUCI_v1c07500 [Williamsoniiplasma lucivorax]